MRLSTSVIIALAATFAAVPVQALDDAQSYGYGALELYTPAAPSGHGVLLLGTELRGLPRRARLKAELNTDTLRVGFDRFELDGGWSFGARIHGQYQFAGLLTDHYRAGELVEEAGFSASRIGGQIHVESMPEPNLWIRLEVTTERWFFSELDATARNLVLPPDTWLFSPRLRLTYWGFQPDASHWDEHRPFWRTVGFGAGISVGLDHRTDARRWGFPASERNVPESSSANLSQWVRWGIPFARHWRLELFEEAGLQTGADDLTRARIGGSNPYVTLVPGAPWAAFLSSAWIGAGLRQRVALTDELEVGAVAAGSYLSDPRRLASDEFGLVTGFGIEVDWRPSGRWQVDGSVGFSPNTKTVFGNNVGNDFGIWRTGPQVGLYLGAGRSF